jgi:hypothetical protein
MLEVLERVDRVTTPLVVGRSYLVPTVRGMWLYNIRNWPIIGPRHTDADFFDFAEPHYHVDGRFLKNPNGLSWRDHETFRMPLHEIITYVDSEPFTFSLGPIIFRRRRCYRNYQGYPFGRSIPVAAIRKHYAGHQCPKNKDGAWICPHRKASLGSILPVDGVITCPLHGLRINAKTGVVMPPEA